jgi:hypothetical protein
LTDENKGEAMNAKKTIAAALAAVFLLSGCGGIREAELTKARLLETCAQAHPDDAIARQHCECEVNHPSFGGGSFIADDPGDIAARACKACVDLYPDDKAAQEKCAGQKYAQDSAPGLFAALLLLAASLAALAAL